MKRTALFSNGDYHKQKSLTFKEIWNMPVKEAIYLCNSMLQSTGAYLFTDSLAKNLDADWLSGNKNNFAAYRDNPPKAIATTLFSEINPENLNMADVEYLKQMLDIGTKIVPISFGITHDYVQNDVMRDYYYQLSRLAERNEIGCRHEYSVEILAKHGIRNARVIGCPSFFYHMDRDFQVTRAHLEKLESVNFNGGMTYYFKRNTGYRCKFTEYTLQQYHSNAVGTINYTCQHDLFGYERPVGRKDEEIRQFLLDTGRYFFSVDDWIKAVSQDDFTFGFRLHGTVASILAGTPALCIANNSQNNGKIRKMSEFFKFPIISYDDLEISKSLEHYYELADYSQFNKNYAKMFDNFVDYCRKNEIDLKIDSE
jgi:hypothetical protein